MLQESINSLSQRYSRPLLGQEMMTLPLQNINGSYLLRNHVVDADVVFLFDLSVHISQIQYLF